MKMAVELSPDIKRDFENICRRFLFDNVTQQRTIYLFEELAKKQHAVKSDQIVILRVSAFIAAKLANIHSLSFASFMFDSDIPLDTFIQVLKAAIESLDIDPHIKDDIKTITSRFSFFSSLHAKFEQTCQRLELHAKSLSSE